MESTQSIVDWVALVTGGGTGIGRGIALALARQGANVIVCGRRRLPLEETVETIWRLGRGAQSVQADVSKPEHVDRVIKFTLDTYDGLDILVNNAGIGGGASIHTHHIDDWDQVMAINLRGPFLMSRAVLPIMRSKKQGHIIQISSESGLEYYPGDGAYGVSKHALNALGEYIQKENQDLGIRVDTICPGMVVSEMTNTSPGLDHEKCLYPEDIGNLVVWLVTRRPNVKIGRPILIQTMENPWE